MKMNIGYFPGCTLKATALNFEKSALEVAKILGFQLEELSQWHCCGTVPSLSQDDLLKQISPVRNLIYAQSLGYNKIVTLCSMCYNTLAQSNLFVKENKEKLRKINQFMSEMPDYDGGVEVKHFLSFLKEQITLEKIRESVKTNLSGIKIACYYGCLLLRPKIIGIDDSEQPKILEELMQVLGAEPVYFPYKTECCGAYHTVIKPDIVARRVYRILENAKENKAQIVITSCPLCHFNLTKRQEEIKKIYPDFKGIPVVYFTEVMLQALGENFKCV